MVSKFKIQNCSNKYYGASQVGVCGLLRVNERDVVCKTGETGRVAFEHYMGGDSGSLQYSYGT